MLRLEQRPPAAVLKAARGPLGAAELRTQRCALAELAIHQELDAEWRRLRPRIQAFDKRTDRTMALESFRSGMGLAKVLARCLLGQWVVEPLADLPDMCRRLDRRRVPAVIRLGRVRRRALVWVGSPVSWTHGG
ncbi:hypothetical protein [Mycobacterium sp.]|uniref:hypothetical protein n=1 Tax=Mycobacterium sp. TaxID=1785 RepID=UPI002BE0DA3F|nr:hypothetical protein [Mycobacterium sp.]HTY31685.1 hypothetical protein [Mycobacterium sp.]